MNNETLKQHPYIQELLVMEAANPDRYAFHEKVKPLLLKMGSDQAFLQQVIRRNFDDLAYLTQTWSLYNIPYFHVYETDDFVLKIHLFPGAENYVPGIAAHAIHHHNNYILTTNAFFGSGYESILFDKEVKTDDSTLRTKMRVNKHFHQKDWNPSMVDAWEPHIVFIPEKLSATMLIWTPEKKRATDTLRNVKLLKLVKMPLRKLIQWFKLESTFGIAKGKTYQYYAAPDGNGFMAIEEEHYFAPTKAANGESARSYCMQILFSFLQKSGLADTAYFTELMQRESTPAYYKPWLEKMVAGETIPEAYHRTEINIPQKTYTLEDILQAASND
jgi:hypothetical protein